MSDTEEVGLCEKCGVFGKIYPGTLCELCYNENIDQQNSYAYEDEIGVSVDDQHIDDFIPPDKLCLGKAIDKIIPYDYDGDIQKCTICLDNIKKGDTVVSLPCSHIFHGSCIYSWLRKNEECPVCRSVAYGKE